MKKQAATPRVFVPAENRTRVARITTESTSHYTTGTDLQNDAEELL